MACTYVCVCIEKIGRIYCTLLKDSLSLKVCIIWDLNLLHYTFLHCLKFCLVIFYYFNWLKNTKIFSFEEKHSKFKVLSSLYQVFRLPSQWPIDLPSTILHTTYNIRIGKLLYIEDFYVIQPYWSQTILNYYLYFIN